MPRRHGWRGKYNKVAQHSKCLVIDTDIAHSAGGVDARHPTSKSCRDFLSATRDSGHKVVTTRALKEEWSRHQSRFATLWFASMVARKKVCRVNAPADETLRGKVEEVAPGENKRAAMLKDIHLVEAAFQADKIVISMDETVRHCFHEAARKVGVLKQIAWVNPCKDEENPLDWLREGAELEKERLLGYEKA